jgi:alpha-beta hydrolase superfamily lysophospholipase
MKEFPFFVPYEDQFLAGTLTVPDRDPEALVLLLAGTGAPRSHRFQLWTRTARGLAEHGLASVRLDYRGIGASRSWGTSGPSRPSPPPGSACRRARWSASR